MDIAGVDVEIDVIRELPELEDLVVNPSTEDQNFNSSKYGFKSVKINAIKGDKLDLNPSLEQQHVKGVFTEVNMNPIQTQKISAVPTTQEQVIKGLFDEITVNAIEGQELNLNPSEEQQNFEGVFLGVNINPIQVQEITTDLDFSSSDSIELTAQEGAYIKKATVNKDANLKPEIILEGNTVYGVDGTFKPLDTSDATATAEDIAKDKTAYVNGEKITGTKEANNNNAKLDTTGMTSGKYQTILKSVKLNIDNITNANDMFASCTNLESAEIHSTSSLFQMNRMFKGCTNLKNVNAFETSGLGQNGIYYTFGGCTNLTDESLNNIMQMCIKANKTMEDSRNLKAVGLSSSQVTKCQSLSNYQALIDAGWTTGY